MSQTTPTVRDIADGDRFVVEPHSQAEQPRPYRSTLDLNGALRTVTVQATSAADAYEQSRKACEPGEIVLNFQPEESA